MARKNVSYFSGEILRLMPHLMSGMFKNKQDDLVRGKITVPQYLSLNLIDSGGPLKMKEIAAGLNVSLPAATGLINRLFIMKTVKRVYDKKDRRIIRIVLTPKGKRLVDQIRVVRKKIIENVFGKLTEKERKEYLRILKKLMKIIYPDKTKKKRKK
ncbi:MAG: MarR family transcriptional regulator [Candidatus Omnitrophota bacterium]|nr:MAG: MarR family transcriptional regulator [Candidatus Omnitrophota bacterium]